MFMVAATRSRNTGRRCSGGSWNRRCRRTAPSLLAAPRRHARGRGDGRFGISAEKYMRGSATRTVVKERERIFNAADVG